jgi:hypothetical protein
MQRLLRWADWDIDAVRDDLRDDVLEHLRDPSWGTDHRRHGFCEEGDGGYACR